MKQILFIALALLVAACEKPILDEDYSKENKEANVILHMTQFEQTAFTRAAQDITALCTRLNIAIFDTDGTKVKTVAQKEGDAGYGTVALTLATGTYRLVVIAHNCDGSATITSEEKVTFPNNKVTDTFYYYGDLVVTDAQQSYDLTLTRAVAMFRLVLTDEEIPSNVAKLKFYYVVAPVPSRPRTATAAWPPSRPRCVLCPLILSAGPLSTSTPCRTPRTTY